MVAAGGSMAASSTLPSTKSRPRPILASVSHSEPSSAVPDSKGRRIPSDSAETNSPHTLWRGYFPRSSSRTRWPCRADVIAAAAPAGPPPMTAKSYIGLLSFPHNHAHTEHEMSADLYRGSWNNPQKLVHLGNGGCLAHGCQSLRTRQTDSQQW